MVSLVAIIVWRLPIYIVIPCFTIFATLDGLYLSSALLKVPDGAWFTLALAAFLSSVFVLWRYGKENQWRAEANDKIAPSNLLIESHHEDAFKTGNEVDLRFTDTFGAHAISSLRGIGIFFDKSGAPNEAPAVFVHFLQKFQAAPTVTVFFHIRPLSIPSVPPEERFTVRWCRNSNSCARSSGSTEATLRNFYSVTIRHGYNDSGVVSNNLGLLIYENIRAFLIHEDALEQANVAMTLDQPTAGTRLEPSDATNRDLSSAQEATTLPTDPPDDNDHEPLDQTLAIYRRNSLRHRLAALQTAFEDQVVYIVGKEQMRIGLSGRAGVRGRAGVGAWVSVQGWTRRFALAAFLWLRSNTGRRVGNMNLEVGKLVEVGFVKVV